MIPQAPILVDNLAQSSLLTRQATKLSSASPLIGHSILARRRCARSIIKWSAHLVTYPTKLREGLAHVIAWSLEAPDAVGIIRHEGLNYHLRAGLPGDTERAVLADAGEHSRNTWMMVRKSTATGIGRRRSGHAPPRS